MKTPFVAYCDTRAHRHLTELASNPFDLTQESALINGDRWRRYVCHGTQFSLHYWGQRVDDTVMTALQELADECQLITQFKAMRRGAVLNQIMGFESEERQVLHCSCRDVFGGPHKQPEASSLCLAELEKLHIFLQDLDNGKITNTKGEPFDTMIHVGIGGSDLGPRAIYEALKYTCRHKVYFISNVDPDDGAAVLEGRDLGRTLVTIVSKSGTTLETRTNEELVKQAFVEQGLDPKKHLVAVTGKGSPMDNPNHYLQAFYMFDFIGGRYSVTSMVGGVMLGFAMGYDNFLAFLKGAHAADELSEESDLRYNPALLLALLGIWNHNYLGMPTLAVLPYCQPLHRFPAHLQQCDMESNGKSTTRTGENISWPTGPVVWGEPGTNGQHAFYQLLHQGREVVPCEFIGFRQSQRNRDLAVEETLSREKLLANMLAQSVALASGQRSNNPNRNFPGNRPNSILIGEKLTPEAMGELLGMYEAKIAFQGFAWNVNSFDQEGVQLGKVLAEKFLAAMRQGEAVESNLQHLLLKSIKIG